MQIPGKLFICLLKELALGMTAAVKSAKAINTALSNMIIPENYENLLE